MYQRGDWITGRVKKYGGATFRARDPHLGKRPLEDNDDEPAYTTKIRVRPLALGRTP